MLNFSVPSLWFSFLTGESVSITECHDQTLIPSLLRRIRITPCWTTVAFLECHHSLADTHSLQILLDKLKVLIVIVVDKGMIGAFLDGADSNCAWSRLQVLATGTWYRAGYLLYLCVGFSAQSS